MESRVQVGLLIPCLMKTHSYLNMDNVVASVNVGVNEAVNACKDTYANVAVVDGKVNEAGVDYDDIDDNGVGVVDDAGAGDGVDDG